MFRPCFSPACLPPVPSLTPPPTPPSVRLPCCAFAPDLLLLLWPIFFVAASRQDPHLKVRNFRKSVTKPAKSVRVRHPLRHKNRAGPNDGRNGFTDDEEGEQPPAWEGRKNSSEYSRRVSFRRCW